MSISVAKRWMSLGGMRQPAEPMKARVRAFLVLLIWLCMNGVALAQPNIPGPTMGGKQVWSDVHAVGQWRIQRNLLTDHYRLLDEDNWRRAWGTYEECLAKLRQAQKDKGIGFKSEQLVILVHGLGRSAGMFADMQAALEAAGYQCFAINYPSTRQSVKAHADDMARLIENLEGITEVSFVTHSMGSLVVREFLGRPAARNMAIKFNRLVMIAPPNQGSAIARGFKNVALYEWLITETGQDLTPKNARDLPIPELEFGVIAGGRGNEIGYNPVLEGDDDGVVTVEETKLRGMKDFIVIDSPHGRIDNQPFTVREVLSFLGKGEFVHVAQ